MEPFATAADVEEIWQSGDTFPTDTADALLVQASAKLRVLVPTIDTLIADDVKAELAKIAVVNAVRRVLRNPDGLLQEQIDDYTWRRDSAVSAGSLYIDPADLIGLVPRASRKWGTIRLGHAL